MILFSISNFVLRYTPLGFITPNDNFGGDGGSNYFSFFV